MPRVVVAKARVLVTLRVQCSRTWNRRTTVSQVLRESCGGVIRGLECNRVIYGRVRIVDEPYARMRLLESGATADVTLTLEIPCSKTWIARATVARVRKDTEQDVIERLKEHCSMTARAEIVGEPTVVEVLVTENRGEAVPATRGGDDGDE